MLRLRRISAKTLAWPLRVVRGCGIGDSSRITGGADAGTRRTPGRAHRISHLLLLPAVLFRGQLAFWAPTPRITAGSGLEHHLDAAVTLLLKCLVGLSASVIGTACVVRSSTPSGSAESSTSGGMSPTHFLTLHWPIRSATCSSNRSIIGIGSADPP